MASRRDLELQAILDATDSDSSLDEPSTFISRQEGTRSTKTHSIRDKYSSTSNRQFQNFQTNEFSSGRGHKKNDSLEQILRDEDAHNLDTSDEYDFGLFSSSSNNIQMQQSTINLQSSSENDAMSISGSTISTRMSFLNQSSNAISYSKLSPRKTHSNRGEMLSVVADNSPSNTQKSSRYSDDQLDKHTSKQITTKAGVNILSHDSSNLQLSNDTPNNDNESKEHTTGGIKSEKDLILNAKTSKSNKSFDSHFGNHHSAEEWAVLQSILGEADDDVDYSYDEDNTSRSRSVVESDGGSSLETNSLPTINEYMSTLKDESVTQHSKDSTAMPALDDQTSRTSYPKRRHFTNKRNTSTDTSTSMEIDDILYSMDDDSVDDDFESNLAELDDMVSKFSISRGDVGKKIDKSKLSSSGKNLKGYNNTCSKNQTPTRNHNHYTNQINKESISFTPTNPNETSPQHSSCKISQESNSKSKLSASDSSRKNDVINISPLDGLQSEGITAAFRTATSPEKKSRKNGNFTIFGDKNNLSFEKNKEISSAAPNIPKTTDAMTAAALRHAESYERRLLRPGQKDIISPLMVKRRMKPRIELMTKSRMELEKSATKEKCANNFNRAKLLRSTSAISMEKDYPHFDFAGIIESKSMSRISSDIRRHSRPNKQSIGLPTCIAVGSKFIAVGTQGGNILVFDLFEELRQQLGDSIESSNTVNGESHQSPVTSIDFSPMGERLIAGYGSGCVTLWDVISGTIVKSVKDAHPSPISSVRFVLPGGDSGQQRSITAPSIVSVDAGGLVNRLTFSKTMLWNSYSVDTECLLDGTAGQILATHVLPPLPSSALISGTVSKSILKSGKNDKGIQSAYHPSIRKLVLVALSSDRSSFAVAVEPSVSVLHKWARPSHEQINIDSFKKLCDIADSSDKGSNLVDGGNKSIGSTPEVFLPCLSWGWAMVSGGENSVTPILARAWGCSLQFLRASFPPQDDDAMKGGISKELGDTMHWPAFGLHDEFDSSAPVVALEWLGDRSLVYLTITNEFTVVDTVMMTLTERLDFSGIKFVYAEFTLSRAVISSSDGTDKLEPCTSMTFQNSIRTSDNRLLILCQDEVKSVSILGIQERITALEEDGEWLEALALALDHYESTIKSQEDRKRNADGTRDLSTHPEFISRLRISEDEEWIAELLVRYLNLAIENAPDSSPSSEPIHLSLGRSRFENGSHLVSSRIDLAKSHFQMLAGVCVEFCITTRRLDLLFNDIYQRFASVGYTSVFLDVLEPYILNDKLKYIAPEVMAQFVEHCKQTNDVSTVERCLLHMDVTIMDFDSILSLLSKNRMYSALLHVFSRGLDDFITPLEILFEAIFDAADTRDLSTPRRLDGVPRNCFEQYGYKALLFLKYCFEGLTFPQRDDLNFLNEGRVDTLRPQLLNFLCRKEYQPSDSVRRSSTTVQADHDKDTDKESSISLSNIRKLDYPYMYALVIADTKALLDTMMTVFDTPGIQFIETDDNQDSLIEWHEKADVKSYNNNGNDDNEQDIVKDKLCPDRMTIVRVISSIVTVLTTKGDEDRISMQMQTTSESFLDFIAKYLLKGVIRTPKPLTLSILRRISNQSISSKLVSTRRWAQEETISLLRALPQSSYDRDAVLEIVEKAKMSRAALVLHKAGFSEIFEGEYDGSDCAMHFMRVIDCYIDDHDIEFRREIFDYIKKECMGGTIMSSWQEESEEGTVHDIVRNALCKKLPALVNLDPVLSSQLVAEMYVEDIETILQSLVNAEKGLVLFKFLHSIISGDLTKIDNVAGPVLLASLNIIHHQKYLELMAKFHPDMVYQHLISHDNYRIEECLKLCQEHDIADATAYLLERMGNVTSALQLMLQTLEGRMMTLKRVVRGLSSSSYSLDQFKRNRFNLGRRRKESEDSAATTQKEKEIQGVKQILIVSLDLCERNSGRSSERTEHGSQLWFVVLDRLINAKGFLRLSKELPEHSALMLSVLKDLLQLTMQRMVSNVPLPDLVRKITTDHAGNRLSEFREMIATMMKTYNSEVEVCTNAFGIMQLDIRRMATVKRRLKLKGARVDQVMGQPFSNIKKSLPTNVIMNTSFNINHHGDARIFHSEIDKTIQKSNQGTLSCALYKLRNRRAKDKNSASSQNFGQPHSSFDMKTVNDKLFASGESSDVAYMPRVIGILSDADNYGRLL